MGTLTVAGGRFWDLLTRFWYLDLYSFLGPYINSCGGRFWDLLTSPNGPWIRSDAASIEERRRRLEVAPPGKAGDSDRQRHSVGAGWLCGPVHATGTGRDMPQHVARRGSFRVAVWRSVSVLRVR